MALLIIVRTGYSKSTQLRTADCETLLISGFKLLVSFLRKDKTNTYVELWSLL